MKKFLTTYLPVFIWAGLIFIGSTTTGRSVSDVGLIDFLAHKTVHVMEYAIFFVLLQRATKKWWLSLAILGLYAMSDEFHQSFTPGRSPKATDVLIDLGSGILGLYLFKLWPKLSPRVQPRLKK